MKCFLQKNRITTKKLRYTLIEHSWTKEESKREMTNYFENNEQKNISYQNLWKYILNLRKRESLTPRLKRLKKLKLSLEKNTEIWQVLICFSNLVFFSWGTTDIFGGIIICCVGFSYALLDINLSLAPGDKITLASHHHWVNQNTSTITNALMKKKFQCYLNYSKE